MPTRSFAAALALAVLLAANVFAGQPPQPPRQPEASHRPELQRGPGPVSTMGLVAANRSHGGFSIVPAKGVPARVYTEDYAPPQVLEINRPNMQPFTVGRIYSSCTCLEVSMDKHSFGPGERALVYVRNVKPTQPNGATYALFVQLTHPFREALQYDIFMKSDRFPSPDRKPAAHAPQAPTPPRPHVEPPRPHVPTPQVPHPVVPEAPKAQPKTPEPKFNYEDIKPYPKR